MIGTDEGAQAIYPHSESEYRDSQNFSKGNLLVKQLTPISYLHLSGSAHSQFEMKALEKTQALRNALVVYLGSVSEFTGKFSHAFLESRTLILLGREEPELTLVLSPMVTKSRRDDASSRTLGALFLFGSYDLRSHPIYSPCSHNRRCSGCPRQSEQPAYSLVWTGHCPVS